MKYRPEIDGLRAISVTSVILFHAGIAGFAGGFVGVDIFFVISGFLITQILIEEIGAGTFSIARFYERRARRILPALYLVLAVSGLVAGWLLLPSSLVEFSRSVMATLLFCSNVWFWWRGSDYFSPDAERDPMLHTWSLGVEEQFYFIFPLLLLLLWRFGRSRVFLILAGISVLSLALAEIGWRVLPEANFFLLPTRAWQLGLGALGAFVWSRPGGAVGSRPGGAVGSIPGGAVRSHPGGAGLNRFWSELAALTGLVLVVACVFTMDGGVPFPSLYALLPTGGALLILLFATQATWTGRLLAVRPMVWIGLISYSAYLWHQPVLAFARIAAPDELTLVQKLGLCAFTFLLAFATLILVERPFRDRAFLSQRRIFTLSLLSSLVLLGAAFLTYRAQGFRDAYPAFQREMAGLSPQTAGAYVRDAYNRHGPGDFTPQGGPRLLIIGDSYSQDFYNMIRETGAFPGYQIALRYFLARCQIYLGPEDITPLLAPEDHALCARQTKAADITAIAREADVVVFVLSWRDWSAARLPTTIANFQFRPDQKVLVLGRKYFGKVNRPIIAGKTPAELAALRLRSARSHLEITQVLRAALSPELLVDTQKAVCGGDACPMFTPEGALISLDGAHLTREGAKYVGSLLFADPHLKPFAAPPGASSEAGGGAPGG